ncbi:MAG: hypothetical protein ABH834_05095 [Candidatus Altiarchaeota archaeon]
MLSKISDFTGLESHVKSCGLPFKEAVIDYYAVLGERLGFNVRKGASVIKYGVNLGKLDLVWLEPNIVFCLEFGSIEEMLAHLWRIQEHSPEQAVFVLSSKSGCKPSDVKRIVENSSLKDKAVILDVSEKKVAYP